MSAGASMSAAKDCTDSERAKIRNVVQSLQCVSALLQTMIEAEERRCGTTLIHSRNVLALAWEALNNMGAL